MPVSSRLVGERVNLMLFFFRVKVNVSPLWHMKTSLFNGLLVLVLLLLIK